MKDLPVIKSLGILGGTFDPIHYGHLVAAEWARETFSLDQVFFVPAARPPHKSQERISDFAHRHQMLELAIAGNHSLALSDIEQKRAGLSYTVETVAYFRHRYPAADLFFILGTDALQLIATWKEVERLARMCFFIGVSRPGFEFNIKEERYKSVPALFWDRLFLLTIPGLFIASSDIRKRISQGKTVRYLLPNQVEEYIFINSLYTVKEENHD